MLRDLPRFADAAFMDRVCAFLEGWRVPKLSAAGESLASGYGLYSFYLAEILHLLRRKALSDVYDSVEVANATIRDERSVKRNAEALAKLLFPHGEYDKSEMKLAARLAAQLRQNVRRILHYMVPHEYPDVQLELLIQ